MRSRGVRARMPNGRCAQIRLHVGGLFVAVRNTPRVPLTSDPSPSGPACCTEEFDPSRAPARPSKGREIPIGRVEAALNLGALELERRQLPIRVAFAMTINKAQ